jgi:ABC-type antimicrobial peptide transport system ATPase subunit
MLAYAHGRASFLKKVGLKGHKQAVDAFQKEASDGANAKLKAAAPKALPTILHIGLTLADHIQSTDCDEAISQSLNVRAFSVRGLRLEWTR